MPLLDRLESLVQQVGGPIRSDLNEVPREVQDAVGAGLAQLRTEVDDFASKAQAWALDHPDETFALLRRVQPILITDQLAVVTRYDDVKEVLSRQDVFRVTYGPKMEAITLGSNFFLGMDDTPEATRDLANMRLCVRREDLPGQVVPLVERTATELVAAAPGRMDVVRDLTRVVPTRLVGTYFGLAGPDDQTFADWATTLFQFIFVDPTNDPALAAAAATAAAHVRATIDGTIAARKSDRGRRDDVLERCLTLQDAGLPGMTDRDIRNNLLGLLVGLIPTTSQAAAQALDQLLMRPDTLAEAQAAARSDDLDLLGRYTFEALRFNPINPGLLRVPSEDVVMAHGTMRTRTIPKGRPVLAATRSAMQDAAQLDQPEDFRIDRPGDDYLHFGFGPHTCFGRYINVYQIPLILRAILRKLNLRRAAGPAGKLIMSGPFPSSMTVEFDA